MAARIQTSFDRAILSQAVVDAFKKLHPIYMLKNPVMFVTEIGAALTASPGDACHGDRCGRR